MCQNNSISKKLNNDNTEYIISKVWLRQFWIVDSLKWFLNHSSILLVIWIFVVTIAHIQTVLGVITLRPVHETILMITHCRTLNIWSSVLTDCPIPCIWKSNDYWVKIIPFIGSFTYQDVLGLHPNKEHHWYWKHTTNYNSYEGHY